MTKLYNKIVQTARRKTLAVCVEESGEVIVRAPQYISETEIDNFVEKHKEWILKKKTSLVENRPQRIFADGELFYYKGQLYPLEFNDSQLKPFIFDKKFLVASRYQKCCRELMLKWYKTEAEKIIFARTALYADAFNLRYKKIKLNSAKRQWGSCTSDGNLSFVWRLVMMPTRIIDYVIAHELAHLNEMNHSPAFWHEVAKMRPDYKECKAFLKEKGNRFYFE